MGILCVYKCVHTHTHTHPIFICFPHPFMDKSHTASWFFWFLYFTLIPDQYINSFLVFKPTEIVLCRCSIFYLTVGVVCLSLAIL